MSTTIGYYVSARQDHPAFSILLTLEQQYGSYFEVLSLQDLQCVLAYSVQMCLATEPTFTLNLNGCSAQAHTCIDVVSEFDYLDEPASWYLALIPFLHDQLQSRHNESNYGAA